MDDLTYRPNGCNVVELGLFNATIHKVNECVSVAGFTCSTSVASISDRMEQIISAITLFTR